MDEKIKLPNKQKTFLLKVAKDLLKLKQTPTHPNYFATK